MKRHRCYLCWRQKVHYLLPGHDYLAGWRQKGPYLLPEHDYLAGWRQKVPYLLPERDYLAGWRQKALVLLPAKQSATTGKEISYQYWQLVPKLFRLLLIFSIFIVPSIPFEKKGNDHIQRN